VGADHSRDFELIPRFSLLDQEQLLSAQQSLLGIMNDFVYLADAGRSPTNTTDLLELSHQLAHIPCGPLYRSQVSPDREIIAYIREHSR
jgi:hypothetical protein